MSPVSAGVRRDISSELKAQRLRSAARFLVALLGRSARIVGVRATDCLWRSAYTLGVLAVVVALPLGARARTLRSSDIGRIVDVGQPAIAPDGKRIAFIAMFPDRRRAAYSNELLAIDVASRGIATLVVGHDVSTPRWSADGARLGYIALGADGKHAQVFVRDGAARVTQITHAARDVVDFAWRPDGAAIAFAAYDVSLPARAHPNYFEAGDNDYTATSLATPIHLWSIPAAGGAARRLTSGGWALPPTDRGGIFTPQFAWTPDGRRLLYTRVANTVPGDDDASALYALDVASGRNVKLTAHTKLELTPQPAPSGSHFAYWYPRGGDFLSENELHVVSHGRDVALTESLDRNVGGSLWLPDGKSLLICGDDGARVRAWVVSLAGERRRVELGERNIVCDAYSSSTFDAGIAASVARNGSVAFVATDARTARELYYMPSLSQRPRRLTHFNAFSERLQLGSMQPFAWRSAAGRQSGVLTYPPQRRAGRRYPIVLLIHGGPGLASVTDFAWEHWPLAQLIAARGYIVFQPNYRGSDSDGNAYMHAIYQDTVEGPARDILSGLAAVERLPSADATRVGVSGWSYGGLLTSWLTAHHHAWRAAVSGAAVNDEIASYDLSVSNVQNRYYFGTSPYARGGRALYRSQSPIEFARDITTPTLIWSSTGDPVVPVSMSYAMFHALKDNGVPVKFVVFSSQTHGPSTFRDAEDLTNLWVDWLDRYLR